MKKIALLAAVLTLILAFGGCGSSDTIDNDQIAKRQTMVKAIWTATESYMKE